MNLKHTAAAMFACCFLAGTATAAPLLGSFNVTPSSTIISQPNSLTVTFTSRGNFAANGYIDLKLPATFTVADPSPSCALITVTVDGAPASLVGCGKGLGAGEAFTRMANAIPNGAQVRVTYGSALITNAPTPGTYPIHVMTTSGGFEIGEAVTSLTLAAPTPIPTLSEWAMIAMGLTLAGGAALYIQRRRLIA